MTSTSFILLLNLIWAIALVFVVGIYCDTLYTRTRNKHLTIDIWSSDDYPDDAMDVDWDDDEGEELDTAALDSEERHIKREVA